MSHSVFISKQQSFERYEYFGRLQTLEDFYVTRAATGLSVRRNEPAKNIYFTCVLYHLHVYIIQAATCACGNNNNYTKALMLIFYFVSSG